MNVLIIGANGQVGSALVNQFTPTSHHIIPVTRKQLDCSNGAAVEPALSLINADIVINAAAYTAVDKAEEEMGIAYAVNRDFVKQLAISCKRKNIPLIHLSTDYVFDGRKLAPYHEDDIPNPQGIYAKSKRQGEEAIAGNLEKHIIMRISWVFGLQGSNFVKTILKLALSRTKLKIVADQWGRPTSAQDVARVIVEIVNQIKDPGFSHWGLYHYASAGVTSWYQFASYFLSLAKEQGIHLALNELVGIKTEEYPTKALRPANSVLDTGKIERILNITCRSWKEYLPELINQFSKEEQGYALSN